MRFILVSLLVAAAIFFNISKIRAQQNFKAEFLSEVNGIRKAGCMCGDQQMPPVPELRWNDRLERAAMRHARDMHAHDHFDHIGTDGSTLSERAEAAGYKWKLLGENLAWGTASPEETVEGWVLSEGHCKTMMNPGFREMGAARKGGYWVLDMAAGK